MRARLDVDARAHRLDHTGAFMPEDSGTPRGRSAVDRVEVAVADAARM
jgi:hypothetical protein